MIKKAYVGKIIQVADRLLYGKSGLRQSDWHYATGIIIKLGKDKNLQDIVKVLFINDNSISEKWFFYGQCESASWLLDNEIEKVKSTILEKISEDRKEEILKLAFTTK